MRIAYLLVDLVRLEALHAVERPSPLLGGLPLNLHLEFTETGEVLPAVVANDPGAWGCIVGDREVGAAAFIALKSDLVSAHDSASANKDGRLPSDEA